MSVEASEGAVTVLFTDVEASTDMRTRLGDEAADELLRLHESIVRERVSTHGGREIKSLGDGFMVAFASPRKAISCAVDIQRALDDRNREDPRRILRVRIGINTGEVSEKAGDLFGAAVNAAARIAGKAHGGQILVANVVKDLAGVRPDLSYVDRGLFWLKGFPERWRLFEILRRAAGPVEELTAPAAGKTPFIGRESERADLRRFVEEAARGQGSFVLIGGEPGVGKTRISEEVAEEASNRGIMALVGHCPETEAGVPYAPVVEIMEATIRGVSRETLAIAFGDTAPELARMVPELRRIFPDLPPPLELPPEQERRYLFNCFTEFIERASHLQPLLFILEDVHWADEPTLLLLQHVAQRLSSMPIMLLATYRDVELDVERPLARTLEELHRRRLAHRISLSRLPKDGVSEMLSALAGRDAPPKLVNAVYNETEGNCFFVEEVFQHLNEEGKLFDPSGAWRTEVEVGEIDVPEGVRLVLGRRLSRLSETARRTLSAAAVIGRSFTYELAGALEGVGADQLLDAIEEAQRARLVTSSEDPLRPRFEFAHELIRQTLLQNLALPRRQRLHLHVAEAIERVYASDLDPHVADIAHHLYQAGVAANLEKSTDYLIRAGDRALAGAAFEEAHRAFERAASLHPDADRLGKAELLVKLGFAQRALGHLEQSLASWREALDLYAELDDREAAASVCWEIANQAAWSGRAVEGIEFIQRGLMAIGDSQTTVRGFLLASGGGVMGYLGDHAGGTGMIDEALTIAAAHHDGHLEGYALLARAIIAYGHAEHGSIVADAPRAIALLRQSSSPYDLASYLSLAEWSYMVTGDVARAVAINEELEPLSQRLGHTVAYLLTRRGVAYRRFMESPDLDEWEAFARWDMEFCVANELDWKSNSHGFMWGALFRRGRWEESLQHARMCHETELPGGFSGWAWPTIALTLAHLGRRDEVLAMYAEAKASLPTQRPATWGGWCTLGGAVEALALIGEREEVARLYPLLLECKATGALVVRAYEGKLTETLLGIAAAAGRQWSEAEAHFAAAIEIAPRFPGQHEVADARRYVAAMLIDRAEPGDADRAREHLEAASDIYRSIGMIRHLELAEAMLKSL